MAASNLRNKSFPLTAFTTHHLRAAAFQHGILLNLLKTNKYGRNFSFLWRFILIRFEPLPARVTTNFSNQHATSDGGSFVAFDPVGCCYIRGIP